MDICIKTKVSSELLARKVSSILFDSINESGAVVVIADSEGNYYRNNEEAFSRIFNGLDILSDITMAVADGYDPLYCDVNGYSVYSSQVYAGKDGNIYAMVALSSDKSMNQADLAETVLSQIELIASLIEDDGKVGSVISFMGHDRQACVLN